jgi:hypothetical protein
VAWNFNHLVDSATNILQTSQKAIEIGEKLRDTTIILPLHRHALLPTRHSIFPAREP